MDKSWMQTRHSDNHFRSGKFRFKNPNSWGRLSGKCWSFRWFSAPACNKTAGSWCIDPNELVPKQWSLRLCLFGELSEFSQSWQEFQNQSLPIQERAWKQARSGEFHRLPLALKIHQNSIFQSISFKLGLHMGGGEVEYPGEVNGGLTLLARAY